jgi:uncharacterized protein (TIGR02611 family)
MLNKIRDVVDRLRANLPHPWRWLITVIAGFFLVMLGIILLPLPGPGGLVIVLGLTVLAVEFEWAREAVTRSEQGFEWVVRKIRSAWQRLWKK